jgi:hypothetical protein
LRTFHVAGWLVLLPETAVAKPFLATYDEANVGGEIARQALNPTLV